MASRLRIGLLVTAALLLDACGDAGGGAGVPSPAPAPTPSPVGLVLRIDRGGGLPGPAAEAGQVPVLSGYADGRLITRGPQIAIYPAPALPSVQVRQVSPETVTGLAAEAVAAGVQPGTDFGDPRVADATTTTVTAATAGTVNRVAVVALGETTPGDTDLTTTELAARAELRAFVQRATSLAAEPGALDAQPYRATALAVLATPYAAPADELPSRPAARPWPGPGLPGPSLPGPGLPGDSRIGCTVVTGQDVDRLRTAAADASVLTPWASEGSIWNVTFRPLLPDEHTCADLVRRT